MIVWLLGSWLASAQAACPGLVEPEAEVATLWLAPVGRRVGGKRWLDTVRVGDVHEWAESADDPTVGDLLRHLGLRRRSSEPRRPWMAVVFDAPSASMCRPANSDALPAGTVVGGLPVCERGGRTARKGDGCGRGLTRAGPVGPEVLRIRWRDAAAQGFCVLPAERFLAGG